jgi:hypothetical protein
VPRHTRRKPSDEVTAAPPTTEMKSRHLMPPQARRTPSDAVQYWISRCIGQYPAR